MVIPGVLPAIVEGASLLYHTFSTSSKADCCRTCTIEIHNRHKHLEFRQPEYHLYSGVNQTPPSPLIRPEDKASCLFRKVYNSSYGTAGVIVYNIHYIKEEDTREPPTAKDPIKEEDTKEPTTAKDPIKEEDTKEPTTAKGPIKEEDTEEPATVKDPEETEGQKIKEPKLVLMWSVPFFGVTHHAIGIENATQMSVSSEELYQKLYYGEEKWFQRQVAGESVKCEDTVFGFPISVMGSISNDGHATWTIEIE